MNRKADFYKTNRLESIRIMNRFESRIGMLYSRLVLVLMCDSLNLFIPDVKQFLTDTMTDTYHRPIADILNVVHNEWPSALCSRLGPILVLFGDYSRTFYE